MNSANSDAIEPSNLWSRNPVIMQLLGISPVLAVSTTLANGIGLGALTALATIPCFLTASLLPRIEAITWRLLFYVLVIASYVSIIVLLTQLTFYPLYRSLGIYVPLICGNAALLYRMELYASHTGPLAALQDSLKTALGFFWIII
ncbi:MAG: electron transport complex subunit RsxE, partial [Gammaproteobacteria bacterium]|nr:electron transport complex subunit RsxE [Gammaproteobacteria bacterium]